MPVLALSLKSSNAVLSTLYLDERLLKGCLNTILVLKRSLKFILSHKSSYVYQLKSRFLTGLTAEFQLNSNLDGSYMIFIRFTLEST